MFIKLSEALATMERRDERGRPVPFSLEVTTCDEVRDTGGQNLVLEHWTLASAGPERPGNPQRVRRTEPSEPTQERRAPQRLADNMRRVRNPANGEVRQLHIRLITAFNGQLIIW